MTERDFEILRERAVAMAWTDLSTCSILEEMSFRCDMTLRVSAYVYDSRHNRYARIPDMGAVIVVRPDQYLGCFSDDGRVEMFSAKIKEVEGEISVFFSMLKVGGRVCVCYDSLAEMGCIRSTGFKGTEVQYALPGYFDGCDFDGEPVEPMSNAELREIIEQMMLEDERAAESDGPDGSGESDDVGATEGADAGESDDFSDGSEETEKLDELNEPDGVATGDENLSDDVTYRVIDENTGGDVEDRGMLSQDELNALLHGFGTFVGEKGRVIDDGDIDGSESEEGEMESHF